MNLRPLVKAASSLFPNTFAKIAYNRLTTPQIQKLREHEIAVLETSEKETLPFTGFDIQLYKWTGSNGKTVLLIHGWEGQAGNFADLIEVLRQENYTVIAFDGPSHGFSSKGKTSLFEFTDLVGELIAKYDVRLLVSHSFGGVATTFGLSNNPQLEIDKYVLLTTPNKFSDRIADVSNQTGIAPKVSEILIRKLEAETKLDVSTLNVEDFVKKANVKKSLIIHDENDRVIPLSQSEQVHRNWKVSELKKITGTGHFRILRTPEVLKDVVGFLND